MSNSDVSCLHFKPFIEISFFFFSWHFLVHFLLWVCWVWQVLFSYSLEISEEMNFNWEKTANTFSLAIQASELRKKKKKWTGQTMYEYSMSFLILQFCLLCMSLYRRSFVLTSEVPLKMQMHEMQRVQWAFKQSFKCLCASAEIGVTFCNGAIWHQHV